MISNLQQKLRRCADLKKAKDLAWFFKTAKGQYGEKDQFLGVTVPTIRRLIKDYLSMDLKEINQLLKSPFHEERMAALIILVDQFQKGDQEKQKEIFDYYLVNTKYINNWDMVDLTAPKIVGVWILKHLQSKQVQKDVLFKLAKSHDLWERRIAVLATFTFIKNDQFDQSLKIAEILLKDKHDLIHKACGWMLREIGKRNLEVEEEFLKKYSKIMPRTMLRYAIEKFSEEKRQYYLKKTKTGFPPVCRQARPARG